MPLGLAAEPGPAARPAPGDRTAPRRPAPACGALCTVTSSGSPGPGADQVDFAYLPVMNGTRLPGWRARPAREIRPQRPAERLGVVRRAFRFRAHRSAPSGEATTADRRRRPSRHCRRALRWAPGSRRPEPPARPVRGHRGVGIAHRPAPRRRPGRRRCASVSMASAPCPTAGHMVSTGRISAMRFPHPRRFNPAAASRMASYWPSSSLRRRVSRLPRTDSTTRSGRSLRKLGRAAQRTGAHLGAGGRSARRRPTTASRGSSRSGTAASTRPSGSSVGRSLRLCTARSARPSSRASSISLVNRPLVPTLASGTSVILSPVVLMISMRHSWPSACQPRLPPSGPATRPVANRAMR